MGKISPVVFALGDSYLIAVPVQEETTMWVKIGDEIFCDEDNGIFRSSPGVRKVFIPAKLLETEKNYTIFLRKIRERKAYFTETEEVLTQKFSFSPVRGKNVKAYHIADVHNHDEAAVKAAKAFGKIDFLILNGDIPNHCDDINNIYSVYRIAWELTGGRIPIVFSRGNHDMRGRYAEKFSEYVPVWNGHFYYTFRLGNIWGMVLDCGEDKEDDHVEYGNTICCKDFRKKETRFIEQIIENAESEYDDPDIDYKMIICHIPFTKKFDGEFNIETDIYSGWTKLLKRKIIPDVILSAHEHIANVYEPGSEEDAYGQPCPVVIGAEVDSKYKALPKDYFMGAGLTFKENEIYISFIDSDGNVKKEYTIKKK